MYINYGTFTVTLAVGRGLTYYAPASARPRAARRTAGARRTASETARATRPTHAVPALDAKANAP